MNITTIIDRMNMAYEHYITQPRQMVELKLILIISRNFVLIKSLDQSFNHALIRKYTNILLNDRILSISSL